MTFTPSYDAAVIMFRLERWCLLACCYSAAVATIMRWLAAQYYDEWLLMVACCW